MSLLHKFGYAYWSKKGLAMLKPNGKVGLELGERLNGAQLFFCWLESGVYLGW